MLWMTGRSQETVDKTIIRPPPNDLCSPFSPLPKISSKLFRNPIITKIRFIQLTTENKPGWFEKEKKTRSLLKKDLITDEKCLPSVTTYEGNPPINLIWEPTSLYFWTVSKGCMREFSFTPSLGTFMCKAFFTIWHRRSSC